MEKSKEFKKASSFRYLERIGLVVVFLLALVTAYFFVSARLIQRDSESIQAQSTKQIQDSAKLEEN